MDVALSPSQLPVHYCKYSPETLSHLHMEQTKKPYSETKVSPTWLIVIKQQYYIRLNPLSSLSPSWSDRSGREGERRERRRRSRGMRMHSCRWRCSLANAGRHRPVGKEIGDREGVDVWRRRDGSRWEDDGHWLLSWGWEKIEMWFSNAGENRGVYPHAGLLI